METNQFFVYSWHQDNEEDVTIIRAYGLDEQNRSIAVMIPDFTPYVYLELPNHIEWDVEKTQMVGDHIDELLGKKKPLKKTLMFKKKLYYAHKKRMKGNKLVDQKFPYLFLTFANTGDIRILGYKVRNAWNIPFLGRMYFKIHEQKANPILQLTCLRKIPTAGWIMFKGKRIEEYEKETECYAEYHVNWKDLIAVEKETVAKPLLMGYDIEVNSTNPARMPKAHIQGDKVFQISCVLARQGDENNCDKYLLSLGEPDPGEVGEDTDILMYETEADLLSGFAEFIREKNPQVIMGYNILGFDIPYMVERAKLHYVMDSFDQQGYRIGEHGQEKVIKWSSSAYKNQEFQFIEAEGRIFVDLLPLVKRDFRLDNYKLKTVATHFLGETKDPLTPKGIFKCYRIGMQGGEKGARALGICAKYCVQDSVLVMKLFEKLETWFGLTEMAKTCNVPIFLLYTRGQGIKVFSQFYLYAMYHNFVIEENGYVAKENEHYHGATVISPVPGTYDKVVPFDFNSLYPATIIDLNICMSTLAVDEEIEDHECNIIEWEDHIGCEHDTTFRKVKPKAVICEHYRYRFLKEPRGVLPSILMNLLEARAKTKTRMAELKKELEGIEDEEERETRQKLINVLNQRQISYKVSANSAYGIMGSNKGYLPFMPGASCTTASARKSLEKAAKILKERYKVQLVYGDSVTEDTPVLCRMGDKIMYRTIDNISENKWVSYNGVKEESNPIEGIEIWSDKGWTKIKRIIRHETDKEIFRVLTHTGVVDVTEDHSLLDPVGKEITPKQVKIGSELMTRNLPACPGVTNVVQDAFVLGLFYADGSCGCYNCPSGKKSSWAINNTNLKYLEKCKKILNKTEENLEFKILDTLKSSGVYKLVPTGKRVKSFVEKYREIFYDRRKYKIVPDFILNGSFETRKDFMEGYYCGDGDKDKNGYYRFDNKGKIGAAGLYFVASSLGYKVSINTRQDKPDIYRLTCTRGKQRRKENAIKKIESLGKTERYVYDIETENHHFSAGIGRLIIHNTDSCYCILPGLETAQEIWDKCLEIEKEMLNDFRRPMKLAFERIIYWRFFILTKKRYMWLDCERDGKVSETVGKKGVLLARRDHCKFVMDMYRAVVMAVFHGAKEAEVLNMVIDRLNACCAGTYGYKNFISTKSVGEIGDYKVRPLSDDPKTREKRLKDLNCTEDEYRIKALPAHVQLAEKMRRRGMRVDAGQRLEYLVTTAGGPKAKLFEKIEDPNYQREFSEFVKLDYLYYIHSAANQLDQVLGIQFGEKYGKFVLQQYRLRVKKWGMLRELEKTFSRGVVFEDSGK